MTTEPNGDAAGGPRPHDAFAALRLPVVRAFALGRMAAVIGVQMMSVAVGWQLYERTGSAWSLGLVGAFELAPVLVLMLPAGHVADRFPRRNVAMFAYVLLAIAALGLALVSASHGPVWLIYLLLVLVGTARAFASPSVASILPQLLSPEHFANANAWLASGFQLAAISGPALGGCADRAGRRRRHRRVRRRRRGSAPVRRHAAAPAGPPSRRGRPPPGRAICSPASASSAATRCSWPR